MLSSDSLKKSDSEFLSHICHPQPHSPALWESCSTDEQSYTTKVNIIFIQQIFGAYYAPDTRARDAAGNKTDKNLSPL